MSAPLNGLAGPELAARARAFHRAKQASVSDSLTPWAHGRVVKASRYPGYYQYNLLAAEDDPGMSVAELAAAADVQLAGLAHRRIDFEHAECAEPLRPAFHALGWKSTRLLWMHHDGRTHPRTALAVEQVGYDDVYALRLMWHEEDFPDADFGEYQAAAREVALGRAARVLAVREGGSLVGFAELERAGDAAEVTNVFVASAHRGRGLGTALTSAAVAAAAPARDVWIVADDEDRPKDLYRRLGFRGAWRLTEITRWP